MSSNDSAWPVLKRKAIHEAMELAWVFAYLAFFFCALVIYGTLLLSYFHVKYLSYAFALLNAFIIAKSFSSESVHVGRRYEGKATASVSYL